VSSSVAVSTAVAPSLESPAERLRALRGNLGNLACRMVPASELPERAMPPTISTGIPSVDALAGGLPCGALTEICGPVSSGRTALLLSTLAELTQEGKACALVDVSDSFDPLSSAAAGVDLRQLLWVRCNGILPKKEPAKVTRYIENDFGVHEAVEIRTDAPISTALAARKADFRKLEQALRAADLLLQGGGFSLIALDAADLAPEFSRRVPMTTWFRFRRGVENTPTAFVLLTRAAVATGCASLSLRMERTATRKTAQEGCPTHAQLLHGMEVNVEMVRGSVPKKRAQSAALSIQHSAFRTNWQLATGN
jgi:recombination protein RecA